MQAGGNRTGQAQQRLQPIAVPDPELKSATEQLSQAAELYFGYRSSL
jgi:hypothetical protein